MTLFGKSDPNRGFTVNCLFFANEPKMNCFQSYNFMKKFLYEGKSRRKLNNAIFI